MNRKKLIQEMKDRCEKLRGTSEFFELRKEIQEYEKNGLQFIDIRDMIKNININLT